MKQRKIIVIRGKVTAGKTTTSHELAKILPGWIFIDPWKIKEMFEPLELKNRTSLKNASKKAMLVIMKEVIRNLEINIIVQETTVKYIKKYLGKDLKKHNYKIYSFFLDIDFKSAIKRDIQREKPTMGLSKFKTEEEFSKKKAKPHRGDLAIDTSKHSIKEVVKQILNEVGERKGKHPRADWIRRCW